MTLQDYHNTSFSLSKKITNAYSTSFSLGIKVFRSEFRDAIYAIYGYVRLADEIVDTFHGHDKKYLLDKFRADTFEAIESGISTNPVINAFQLVVRKYNVKNDLITAFLDSMEKDLSNSYYQRNDFNEYIYGSAEVVGLMCLHVFCQGNDKKYNSLEFYARQLGSAFQKVNFLRDIKSDIDERGRIYLPDTGSYELISNEQKKVLEKEVELEFSDALKGILKLPKGVRLGVYTAYLYYYMLFKKIQRLDIKELLSGRVRISNFTKLLLLLKSPIDITLLELEMES